MNILFRVDSSSIIGTGHVMRDLVLASQFKKSNVIFATQDLKGNINCQIQEAGYKIKILKSNDIDEINELISKHNIEMIVIDHYEINCKYEKELKNKNEALTIFIVDDKYEKHHCDILLNHNISANKKRYKVLVPKNCEVRCGSKYTLLRDEFLKEKKKSQKNIYLREDKSRKKKIFLAMGGADTAHLNIKILKVLKNFKNIKVYILTTSANKNLNDLKKYSQNKDWIGLHVNSNKIAKFMRKSDFAIITPSVIANELLFMEKKFIAIQTATTNQNEMSKYLKENNYSILNSFDKKKLTNHVKDLV